MALESTPDEIKAFLEQLAAQAEITDFIPNLGRDLVASGVLRAEELGVCAAQVVVGSRGDEVCIVRVGDAVGFGRVGAG